MASRKLSDGPVRALLVAPAPPGTWLREIRLPIPPHPGLGIRLDTYDMVNVDSVVVGDDGRWDIDVTCIVSMESGEVTEERWQRLGFELGTYI